MTEPEDPTRRLSGDAAAAFETGVQFLTVLQKRFLQGTAPDPLDTIRATVGAFADKGRGVANPADLVIAGLPAGVGDRFRVGAGARGLTPAGYLTALVDLHEAMRRLADEGDAVEVDGVLRRLGLATVTA